MLPNTIPYENDEVFYSWIMHIIMHNYGSQSYARAFREWMNPEKFKDLAHAPRVNYDFKENLYYWIKNVGWSLQDAMKYFTQTSLYPMMSSFMKSHQRNLYILLAFGKLTMPQINALNTILTTITTRLKLCPECAKEEIKSKGIFWYHRAHQIPGVTACYKHGCKLNKAPQQKFHEMNIDEVDLGNIQVANDIEREYAVFTHQYLNDSECCMYDNMHEFTMMKIKEKFPIDTGIEFEKYTKENGYYSLFSMKPSYFIYRKNEEGTFFDPQNDLVALFALYRDLRNLKDDAKMIKYQKKYIFEQQQMMKFIDQYTKWYEKTQKTDVSARNPRSKELFLKEIYDLTGDEYRLIGEYEKSDEKVTLLHTKCNHTIEMAPISFLSGKRCRYCRQLTYVKDFCRYVENATNNRYTVLGRASNNLYVVHDRETLLDYTLGKAKTLQELNRKSGSSIYFEHIQANKEDLNTTSKQVYNAICENTLSNAPIFLEDIRKVYFNRSNALIKSSFTKLVKEGLIVKCYPGVYRFPKDEFSDLQLLEAKYIKRGGKIIGAYYGNSLASMVLGLNPLDDTKKYIMSNKESLVHGRKINIFGIPIRIKGCKIEITRENYIILQTVDFLLNYWKYTDDDCEKIISSITAYWIKNKITADFIRQYQEKYDWKQNKLYDRAIEVLKCAYQKKENDAKNVD